MEKITTTPEICTARAAALETAVAIPHAILMLGAKELPKFKEGENIDISAFQEQSPAMQCVKAMIHTNTRLATHWKNIEEAVAYFRGEGNLDHQPDIISWKELTEGYAERDNELFNAFINIKSALVLLGESTENYDVVELITNLWSEDLILSEEAAKRLGELGNRKAIEPLLQLLNRKEPLIASGGWITPVDLTHIAAIRSLVQLRADSAVPKLISILSEPEATLNEQAVAIWALGEFGNPMAIAPLRVVQNSGRVTYNHLENLAAAALAQITARPATQPEDHAH